MILENLENVLLALLVIDALALGVLILIQQGKGADVGAAFGGGGSNTMFGSAGSTSFLARLTSWLAVGFFFIAFGLAYTAKERAGSLSDLGMPQVAAPVSGLVDEPVGSPDVPNLDIDVPSLDVPSVEASEFELPAALEDAIDQAGDVEIDTSELTGEVESVDSNLPDL